MLGAAESERSQLMQLQLLTIREQLAEMRFRF